MPERSVREETEYPMKMERYFHRFFFFFNSFSEFPTRVKRRKAMNRFVKADRNNQVGKPKPFHLTSTEIIGIFSIMESTDQKALHLHSMSLN